ncbi:MAG: hypothetical protein V3S32_05325, partial [Acidimicrobiia bacterium]
MRFTTPADVSKPANGLWPARQYDSAARSSALEGTASIDPDVSTPLGSTDYMTKYGDEIVRLGWTHEEYDEEFPVAIR